MHHKGDKDMYPSVPPTGPSPALADEYTGEKNKNPINIL